MGTIASMVGMIESQVMEHIMQKKSISMCMTNQSIAIPMVIHDSTHPISINGHDYVIMRQSEHTKMIEVCGIKKELIPL